jgi:hypothetical protein
MKRRSGSSEEGEALGCVILGQVLPRYINAVSLFRLFMLFDTISFI